MIASARTQTRLLAVTTLLAVVGLAVAVSSWRQGRELQRLVESMGLNGANDQTSWFVRARSTDTGVQLLMWDPAGRYTAALSVGEHRGQGVFGLQFEDRETPNAETAVYLSFEQVADLVRQLALAQGYDQPADPPR